MATLSKNLKSAGSKNVVEGEDDDESVRDISDDEEEVDVWTPPASVRGRRTTVSPQPSTSARGRSMSTPKTPRKKRTVESGEGNLQ